MTSQSPVTTGDSNRSLIFTILAIYTANVVLRLPAISHDLPPLAFVDEEMYVAPTGRMLRILDFTPAEFLSGAINYYIPLIPEGLWRLVTGSFPDAAQATVLARIASVLLISSLMPVFVFLSVRELSKDRGTVLPVWAAMIATISPLALGTSRIHYPDHFIFGFSSAFFFACTLITTVGAKLRYYILAAVMLSLAISTKYSAVLLVFTLILAHALALKHPTGRKLRAVHNFVDSFFDRNFALAVLCVGFLVAVINLRAMLDSAKIVQALEFHVTRYTTGARGLESHNGIGFYAKLILLMSSGVLSGGLALVGGWGLFKRSRKLTVLFALTLILAVAYLGRYRVVTNRNMNFVLPLIFVFIGFGWQVIMDAISRTSLRQTSKRIAMIGTSLVILAEPIYRTGSIVANDLQSDSRVASTVWIAEHIPAGSRIGYMVFGWGVPFDVQRFQHVKTNFPTEEGEMQGANYYVMDSWWYETRGLGNSMLSDIPMSEQIFMNISETPYRKLRRAQDEFLSSFEMIQEFPSKDYYGPTIWIYRRK